MNDTLEWGHHYLMVEPNHFRVDYAINPFMHLDDQPDPLRAGSSGSPSSPRSRPPAARSRCCPSCRTRPTWSTR